MIGNLISKLVGLKFEMVDSLEALFDVRLNSELD
jgi:hypothetical protein